MAGLRFTDLQSRPLEFLDCTSLTLNEFQQLVPPFETAFQTHMAAWRMDGKPRTARRFTVSQNCPLPTPEDRRWFILVYLKTYALQVVQGRLVGMVQSKANRWIHLLLPVLLAALRALGDAPARSLTALAQRRGGAAAAAAPLIAPREEAAAPEVAGPAVAPASPFVPMPGRLAASAAPKTLLTSKRVIAARKRDHTVKNVLLVHALLLILFLRDTYGGRTHDKPIAAATPYPWPAGSRLLQALGFLACTLPQVDIRMPTTKPRGQALTRAQQRPNQALHSRRLRIEHVNSSVKRCRIVQDRIRLWKEGGRALGLELCCALHNFRVRLRPWQAML